MIPSNPLAIKDGIAESLVGLGVGVAGCLAGVWVGVGVAVAVAVATRCMVEVGVARVGEAAGLAGVGVAMGLTAEVGVEVGVVPGIAAGIGVALWLAARVPTTVEMRKKTKTWLPIVEKEEMKMEVACMHIYIYKSLLTGQILMRPPCINPPPYAIPTWY